MQTTYTITQTIESPTPIRPATIRLKAGEAQETKVAELIKRLQQLKISATEEAVKLNHWFAKLPNNGMSLDALAILVTEIVEPALLIEPKEKVLAELVDIDTQVKALMEQYLPKGIDAEKYLEEYQEKALQMRLKHTMTHKKSSPSVLKPALNYSEKLSQILINLFPLLKGNLENQFETWLEEFTPYLMAKNMQTFTALELLLWHIVNPAMSSAETEDHKNSLKAMHKEISGLMSDFIPGKTIEEMNLRHQQFIKNYDLFKGKVERIEMLVNKAHELLYANANTTDTALLGDFNQSKKELLDLLSTRQKTATAINDRASTVTEKTLQSLQRFVSDLEQVKIIAGNLQSYNQHFHALVKDCQNALKEC